MKAAAAPTSLRLSKMAATRTSIVDAVLRLGREQGLGTVTTREVAVEANIGTRTFFRFFSSKEDAVIALDRELFDAIAAALREQTQAGDLATVVLGAFTSATAQFDDLWWERSADAARLMAASPTVDGLAMSLCNAMTEEFASAHRPTFRCVEKHELDLALDAVFSAWRRARLEWLATDDPRPPGLDALVRRNIDLLATTPLLQLRRESPGTLEPSER
jgi:AcrR family transcriptional regulator